MAAQKPVTRRKPSWTRDELIVTLDFSVAGVATVAKVARPKSGLTYPIVPRRTSSRGSRRSIAERHTA
jgi:hypothetical protein